MNEQHHTDDPGDLQQRRDRMLQQLVASMQSFHLQRRRRKRLVATGAMFMLVCGVLFVTFTRTAPPRAHRLVEQSTTEAASPDDKDVAQPVRVVRVTTDPSVLKRFAAKDATRIVQWMNDDQLIAALAAINRPTGIIRVADSIWLTAAVTDEQLRNTPIERPPTTLPPL